MTDVATLNRPVLCMPELPPELSKFTVGGVDYCVAGGACEPSIVGTDTALYPSTEVDATEGNTLSVAETGGLGGLVTAAIVESETPTSRLASSRWLELPIRFGKSRLVTKAAISALLLSMAGCSNAYTRLGTQGERDEIPKSQVQHAPCGKDHNLVCEFVADEITGGEIAVVCVLGEGGHILGNAHMSLGGVLSAIDRSNAAVNKCQKKFPGTLYGSPHPAPPAPSGGPFDENCSTERNFARMYNCQNSKGEWGWSSSP